MVLMLFLLLEVGYVIASTVTLVSISMESEEEKQALMDDIPKVWSPPLPSITTITHSQTCLPASLPSLTVCLPLRSWVSRLALLDSSSLWLRLHPHTPCGPRACQTRIRSDDRHALGASAVQVVA
jgi:hypothetical protein